jgi:hypothetical protein
MATTQTLVVGKLTAVDDTQAAFNSVQRSAAKTAASSKALNQQFRFLRGGAGQLGHQIQDVAVQLQMGTNAMIVMGQQGGQIASLFGPKGAIVGAFISVAAAAGMTLAPRLMGVERNFDDLDNQIRQTADGLNVFTEAQRKAAIAAQEIKQIELAGEQLELQKETDALSSSIEMQERTLATLEKKLLSSGQLYGSVKAEIDETTEGLEMMRLELALHEGQLDTNTLLIELYEQQIAKLKAGTDELTGSLADAAGMTDALRKAEASRFQQLLDEEQKMLDQQARAREKAEREKQAAIRATQAVQAQSVAFIGAQTGQIMSMLDEQSGAYKALFVVQQATQIAQAIMSAHTAAANALAFIPPPANIPISNLMLALGYANAAAIAGQTIASFEGGGMIPDGPRAGGVDGRGGRMAIVHPNEKITDMRKGGDNPQPVNVSFNIQANDARGFDEMLVKRRALIVNMVNQAINNRGRRSLT